MKIPLFLLFVTLLLSQNSSAQLCTEPCNYSAGQGGKGALSCITPCKFCVWNPVVFWKVCWYEQSMSVEDAKSLLSAQNRTCEAIHHV